MSRSKVIAEFAPVLPAIGDREPTPASKTISPIAISANDARRTFNSTLSFSQLLRVRVPDQETARFSPDFRSSTRTSSFRTTRLSAACVQLCFMNVQQHEEIASCGHTFLANRTTKSSHAWSTQLVNLNKPCCRVKSVHHIEQRLPASRLLTLPVTIDKPLFFAGPERRIANRVRQFPFWYFRPVFFWFGVHNWTELRREKLYSTEMEHDPTQEMIFEICGLLDNNAGFESGQDD